MSRLIPLLLCVLCHGVIPASEPKKPVLPDPAIPGLRYYYPPEIVNHREVSCDICVYGGTSGGVVAAVQAARMGRDVVLLEFGQHLGGLTTGGLSHTDGGEPEVCGGVAREFYKKIGQRNFRPSEAEVAYWEMLNEAGVDVHLLAHLDEVQRQGPRIVSLKMRDGLTIHARQFIDATYEGDLLARAGVSWTAGREANSVYGETYNGIREPGTGGHNWPAAVDPYRVAGDATSGLLPRVNDAPGNPGEGDDRIQAFCFRMRLTKDDPLPFPKPNVYNPEQYELLARLFETGADPHPQFSIDTNNHHLFRGAYFIDFVGGNYDWPDASWAEREQIFQDHANYQIGLMWFLTHSDRVPEKYREEFRKWGLPRDEYEATGGWAHQLYIREGRRMVSDYVMTQHNCQGREVPGDSVGLASYNMDSHHCQMTVVDGAVKNEGNVEIPVDPYPISYRAIVPKRTQCTNLVVPVALSASHIAFGSIRMEPVFMILGQSAATASHLAIEHDVAVQDVPYEPLAEQLREDGQILVYQGPRRKLGDERVIDPESLGGIVIDNDEAEITGEWTTNNVTSPRVGPTYLHDENERKGESSVRYKTDLPRPGQYTVRISWPPNPNRATNVPVMVHTDDGPKRVIVNQKKSHPEGAFTSLGEFRFDETASVVISNEDTDGYVIADAVQLLPVSATSSLENPPNVLMIVADDLGYEMLGCYGGNRVETPNLVRLAEQGMRFDRAYTSPVCTPSRVTCYTGTYAMRHGRDRVLPVHLGTKKAINFPPLSTLPQVLRAAGYATSVTGKWQLATLEFHPEHIRRAGFDSWCVWQIWRDGKKTTRYWDPCFNHDGTVRTDITDRFGPDVLADYVIDQMEAAVEKDKPFYIHHNMLLPHWPIIQTPADRMAGREASLEHMTSYLDRLVGRLTQAVDALGIAEETYIIFVGDNGTDTDQPRELPGGLVRGGKRDLNDGGTHVPLVVRRPGSVAAGTSTDAMVDMADLFPTVCDVTGVTLPPKNNVDGVSFAPILSGTDEVPRRWVTGGIDGTWCVFDGQFRLTSRGRLIDCRELPAETPAEKGDPAARAARARLGEVMTSLRDTLPSGR